MSGTFFDIAFTPNVQAVQQRMGSREAYAALARDTMDERMLGPAETAFIAARDSFYQATVSETGWPYVQHRGGPTGFLKVLDAHTIGYADFTGNRQYISTGNLAGNDRVCLFLMDYPHQARLKILGRARIVDDEHDPELLVRLDNPHYRARVERGIVVRIEGFDWNCPKYITPRYSKDEITQRIRPTQETAAAQPAEDARKPVGEGEIALVITGIRQLTPRIRAYEMHSADGDSLPLVEAGAHIVVPVRMADGSHLTRQYSLAMNPMQRNRYEIAVQREPEGRGGSRTLHDTWHIGMQLRIPTPANHFPLHRDARPAVLIAGGIGITPIKAMAHALHQRKTRMELHYTARTPEDMAYREELTEAFQDACTTYFSRVTGHRPLNPTRVMQRAGHDALFYVCGPLALIDAVQRAAASQGIAPARIQHESFA